MGAREVCVPHSSTKTSLLASIPSATITLQAALRNSLRSLAFTPPFAGVLHASDLPVHRGSAHRDPCHLLQVLPPLGEPGEGALLDIRREQLPCPLIQFRL